MQIRKKVVNYIHRLEALREIVGGTYGKAYYVVLSRFDNVIGGRLLDFKELKLIEDKYLMNIDKIIYNN